MAVTNLATDRSIDSNLWKAVTQSPVAHPTNSDCVGRTQRYGNCNTPAVYRPYDTKGNVKWLTAESGRRHA